MIEPIDLHAFADGELNSVDRTELQAKLDASPDAVRELESIRNLKALLKRQAQEVETRESWKHCVGRLDEIDKARRVESVVGRFAPALCGLFLFTILVGGLVARRHGETSGPKEYVSRLLPFRSSSESKQDKDEAEWLTHLFNQVRQSRIHTFHVLKVNGYIADGIPVTRMSLRDDKGDLLVLLLPKSVDFGELTPMAGHPEYTSGQYGQTNCVARSNGASTTVLLADRPFDELADAMTDIPDSFVTITSHRPVK
ncbi:MAG: hypothetical protein P4L46_25690 [Fimbriimonas sp.]|nr:hypothetical protein [Fimbriimonas sp.]